MAEAGIVAPFDDFERIYSDIVSDASKALTRSRIDEKIYSYFDGLEIPDEPTLYDHLVLSLRPKDVIATFNWDPFLWKACHRNSLNSAAPTLLFLHGSVATGSCDRCKLVLSRSTGYCVCGEKLRDIPILYPVTEKNYNSYPAIAAHWRKLRRALQSCWALTIFGYCAPKTDVEALSLLKDGWGSASSRELEEIEIIDVKDEDTLRGSWDPFIHSHHYTTKTSFYESWIACHPRRSCEAIWAQNMDCMFIAPYAIPKDRSFADLYKWIQPRLKAES